MPLRIRQQYYNRGFPITPEDKIAFLGLNQTMYWSDLDRWDYSDEAVAPPYSIYTLFSLKHTFMAGAGLLAIHILVLLLIKLFTSPDFRRGGYYTKIVKNQSNKTETGRAEEINIFNSKGFDDKAEDALQHTAIELSETDDTNDPPTPPKDTRCPTQRMLDNARLELEEIMYSTKKETSATVEV